MVAKAPRAVELRRDPKLIRPEPLPREHAVDALTDAPSAPEGWQGSLRFFHVLRANGGDKTRSETVNSYRGFRCARREYGGTPFEVGEPGHSGGVAN